ncbi:MAG TPA: 30S ribosomal protein S12 methylthiotransferase RimO [Desulfobacterales bacterium]|nr:30S ribosomal protein S12 methylthiotransferase RimO [Desulfobacterales bacterium]
MNKKLFMVSLGCPKNLVDSELMLASLSAQGYDICRQAEDASLIVVNTCGFIQSAVEEAIDEILSLGQLKNAEPDLRLVVTGCLVQRYGERLRAELPEVDLFLGTDNFIDIAARLNALDNKSQPENLEFQTPTFLMDSTCRRRISTPNHRAYLKISEGCSNRCSYCLIPQLRGPLRSRALDDLIVEAQRLEAAGVKELTLVGQDVTAYGLDFGPQGHKLPDLLAGLLAETAIPWLRMLYLYPNRIAPPLLNLMADNPRLLPYFDIPMQHASDKVLHLMRRPYKQSDLISLIDQIRAIMPESAIRTTLIVGFPGEKEADIIKLEEFIAQVKLNHVGVFCYSNEEGCEAATLPEHCDEEQKEERRQRIMTIQKGISAQVNREMIGKIEKVLVEGLSRETDLLLEGRSRFQAPDIDGSVYINSGTCNTGDMVNLKITDAHPYDLIGEIV